ncbi:RagB/SusD family nutrient uptake outer membrane protein [Marinifilum sp.]|uniref:RagB/SusD family nutrient uptake outer membrane protein n=1 Tax=Marinifilum sp. TaxID=2033137 RepID=UPI003BAAEFE3
MNKLYIFIIVGILFSSCDELVTYDNPKAVTDEDWWNSEQDARSALNTIYSFVPKGITGDGGRLNYNYSADEAYQVNKTDYTSIANGNLIAENKKAEDIWKGSYTYIRRANRFFKYVDNCAVEASLLERFKLEARTLRAWIYLELVMWYGDVPLTTEELSPDLESSLAKTDKTEVLNFVITELEAASNGLPKEYSSNDRWRMTSGAALSFKALAHLLLDQWEEAASAAKLVCESGVYELYNNLDDPANSYRLLFTQDGINNKETIIYKSKGCSSAYSNNTPASLGGVSGFAPLGNLVDIYETLQGKTLAEMSIDSVDYYKRNPGFNRDPRLDATVILPGTSFNGQTISPFDDSATNDNRIGAKDSSPSGYWMKKYVDIREKKVGGVIDYMILRLPDVMLMYAEAMIEQGEFHDALAISYIDEIRARAGMPPVDLTKYNSKESMRQLLRRERRVELALEGRRIYDLRRWEEGALLQVPAYGATNPATGETVQIATRNFIIPDHYLLPIPQSEMLVNDNMIQNDGY